MTIVTVFLQMLSLTLMILVGVLIARRKLVDDHSMGQMSHLINYVFNPMMMLSSGIASVGTVDKQVLFLLFAIVAALYVLFIVLAWLIGPRFDKRPGQSEMFQLMIVFSNIGFMGIPVVRGVFGEEYVVYVLAFVLMYNLFFYTYGVTLMNGKVSRESLKSMLNPGTVFAVITLLIVSFEVRIPDFLANTVGYLGDVASPLAMLAVGVTVAKSDLKTIFLSPKMWLFTLVKMVALPVVMIPLLKLLPFPDTVIGICLVEIGMPVANMTLILGTEKGLDCTNCSAAIIMTTLASVITIPLLVALI